MGGRVCYSAGDGTVMSPVTKNVVVDVCDGFGPQLLWATSAVFFYFLAGVKQSGGKLEPRLPSAPFLLRSVRHGSGRRAKVNQVKFGNT